MDWQTAAGAGIAVTAIRWIEDFAVVPRALGHAVGLRPIVVLLSIVVAGVLLGGFYVLLAIALAAVLATLIDVVIRNADPAKDDVLTLLFSGKRRRTLSRARGLTKPRRRRRPPVTIRAARADRLEPMGWEVGLPSCRVYLERC